jgi:hypothetical protein
LFFYNVPKIFAFVIVKGKDANEKKDNGKKQFFLNDKK